MKLFSILALFFLASCYQYKPSTNKSDGGIISNPMGNGEIISLNYRINSDAISQNTVSAFSTNISKINSYAIPHQWPDFDKEFLKDVFCYLQKRLDCSVDFQKVEVEHLNDTDRILKIFSHQGQRSFATTIDLNYLQYELDNGDLINIVITANTYKIYKDQEIITWDINNETLCFENTCLNQ